MQLPYSEELNICFDVLDKSDEQYNYNEFSRNFNHFYREEENAETEAVLKIIKEKEKNLDKIRGSLIGGAVGDALGYSIEFDSESSIFARYGEKGISEYALDTFSGKAVISDDTQMTLFTANGLLVGNTRVAMRGIGGAPHCYVEGAYQDWLLTQDSSYSEVSSNKRYTEKGGSSWLLDVPELFCRRAPGNTCLSALRHPNRAEDCIERPVNNSKGCGGIMRVAPVALLYDGSESGNVDIRNLDKEGAYVAAITHGHPLGYMPAAVVTHIINRMVYGPKMSLKEAVIEAQKTCSEIFEGFNHLDEMNQIIDLAIELSENDERDLNNIHKLGEGWVAEETLGIALYCALKYQNDFSKAIAVAVNHKGDSDSTGAVTGNILGAVVGYAAIEDQWKRDLELHDVILEMADDLCHGCRMSEYSSYRDPAWVRKYIEMHRYS